MKYNDVIHAGREIMSRPARGGWIEILLSAWAFGRGRSRPARGGWIEIGGWPRPCSCQRRPAPHGAGGLKCYRCQPAGDSVRVPPRTGRVD